SLTLAMNVARNQGYDPDRYTAEVDHLTAVFTPELFAHFHGQGLPDERPVFIVGMPRSGTTLTEQILASHPRPFGAGERLFGSQSFGRRADVFGQPNDGAKQLTADMIRDSASWHLEQLRKLDGGRADRVVDKMPENFKLLGWLALQFPKARFIHCRRN